MINLRATVENHQDPYRWALIRDLIPVAGRTRLRAELPPVQRLARSVRARGGDKTYGMYVLPLLDRGRPTPALDTVGPAWRDLVAAVENASYRAWVHSVVGADVGHSPLDIGVFVFGPGDWVSAHTDKPGKRATHVVYLNESWGRRDGGEFEVRTDGDPRTLPHAVIVPGGGRSALFARSDTSWHAVAPVSRDAPDCRYTIQVEMW